MGVEQETVVVTQKFATDEESIYDALLDPQTASKFLVCDAARADGARRD
jgi:hypothetical protein